MLDTTAKIKSDSQRYAAVIAACRAHHATLTESDRGLWRIGDALIAEVGTPGPRGVKDKSYDRMRDIASELQRIGLNYGLNMLRTLRRVAAEFPDVKRLTSANWSVHVEAGAETLHEVVEYAKARKAKLSVRLVKRFKDQRARKRNDNDSAQRVFDDAVALGIDFCTALDHVMPFLSQIQDVGKLLEVFAGLREREVKVKATRGIGNFAEAAE